jgi:hypothetical protein
MEEHNKIEKDKIKKMIEVLAKAATDQDYFNKLRDDQTRTLKEAGIGEEFSIPNEKLNCIKCMIECLTIILFKRG